MSSSFKQFGLRAISGEDKSLAAGISRCIAAVVEPFYAATMRIRNACYDRGLFASHDLDRPTISVGNITTGGTGKTPVVKWLADQLRQRGKHPAILLRGYGSTDSQSSDEAQLLKDGLKIPVMANPSRILGAAEVLRQHPEVDVFILDDAFQHRRAKRDFNLVLISATQPFGFGHVLPRGLLREPLAGLVRADAFLITRCSLVPVDAVNAIDTFLRSSYFAKPIYHCDHLHSGLWIPATNQTLPMESLAGQKVFVTAGIGDPAAFARQIESVGAVIVGTRWFEDHHAFASSEIQFLIDAAKHAGADRIITTEKDWVKIKTADPANGLIAVTKLEIHFREMDGQKLIDKIEEKIHHGV